MPTPLGTTRADPGFVVPPKKAGRPLPARCSNREMFACLLDAVQPPTDEIATWGGDGPGGGGGRMGGNEDGGRRDMGQGLGDPLPSVAFLSTFWHGKPGDSPRAAQLKPPPEPQKTGCNLRVASKVDCRLAQQRAGPPTSPQWPLFWRDSSQCSSE